MEEYMHLIINTTKCNKKNNNFNINNDLYYIFKKKYKKFVFDKFIFNVILNEINIILNDYTIHKISVECIDNLISEINFENID